MGRACCHSGLWCHTVPDREPILEVGLGSGGQHAASQAPTRHAWTGSGPIVLAVALLAATPTAAARPPASATRRPAPPRQPRLTPSGAGSARRQPTRRPQRRRTRPPRPRRRARARHPAPARRPALAQKQPQPRARPRRRPTPTAADDGASPTATPSATPAPTATTKPSPTPSTAAATGAEAVVPAMSPACDRQQRGDHRQGRRRPASHRGVTPWPGSRWAVDDRRRGPRSPILGHLRL